jgi:MFS family permease
MKHYFRNMSFRSARRDVSLVVLAKSLSWLGDLVAEVALVLRLQSHGYGASAVAALLIANAIPIVLLSGVVGRVVDRLDNQRLLVLSSLGQAAVCSVLAFTTAAPAVLGLVALLGAGQAVNNSCWQALLATAAEGDALTGAIGQAQAGQTIAAIVAPALSGVLVGQFGARVPLLVDAAAYLLVTGIALVIATRRVAQAAAPGAKPRGGLTIVRADGFLSALFVLLAVFVLLGCMVNVVEVFLVRVTLHASTTWYGIAGAVFAVGMLIGALSSARLRGTSTLTRGFVAACLVLSLGLVAVGFAPSVEWVLPGIAVVGFMNGVLNVALGSLVMGRTAADERGRVGALLTGVASGTQILAFAAGGALASVLQPRTIFIAAGLLGVLVPLVLGPGLIRRAGAATPDEAETPADAEAPAVPAPSRVPAA